ncbi:MAG: PTS IIA-like nitrogen regulatory protein PtsN [Alcanivorax sp.]|jgi:PTS system nitrogen regulatory IIA component|nr:MAG: PTS IIA-like nitrogen-regulatory protein PtsN [Oceanobacter sp.]
MTLRIEDILTQERTLKAVPVTSKKKLLEQLASLVAENMATEHIGEASADDIYERLLGRERMGSTGIGEGIAIPHCRLLQCEQAMGVLLQLETPIDYDAIDGKPIDLVFALLVPEEATDEHLQILATLATNFSQESYRESLRNSPDSKHLYTRAIANA